MGDDEGKVMDETGPVLEIKKSNDGLEFALFLAFVCAAMPIFVFSQNIELFSNLSVAFT